VKALHQVFAFALKNNLMERKDVPFTANGFGNCCERCDAPTFPGSGKAVGKFALSAFEFSNDAASDGAQVRDRTTDTAIFNRMLYQLSYLGAELTPALVGRGGTKRGPYKGLILLCPEALAEAL
jgi:hypothetical protein